MENKKQYNDEALRIIMQRKAEMSEQFELSEGFADRLMERLQTQGNAPRQRQKSIWQGAVSTISTMAAVLLIGLLITLHLPQEDNGRHINTNLYTTRLPKSSTLEQVYTSRFGQRDKKQLSYTHLRRQLYEHE